MKFEKKIKLNFSNYEIQALDVVSEIVTNLINLVETKQIEVLYVKSDNVVYYEENIEEFISYYLQELAMDNVEFFSTIEEFEEYAKENGLQY